MEGLEIQVQTKYILAAAWVTRVVTTRCEALLTRLLDTVRLWIEAIVASNGEHVIHCAVEAEAVDAQFLNEVLRQCVAERQGVQTEE